MRGALLAVSDLDDEALARWRDLAGSAVEPNPFFSPAMALAAARHLPEGGSDRLLAVYDADELVLVLPVRRVARYRRAPVPTFLAWGHPQAFLDTPLVAGADPVGAFAAALDVLSAEGAGWLVLERAGLDGPVRLALDAALAARGAPAVAVLQAERPMLRRRPEATYLEGRLSAQRRKRLRRQRRLLEAELGGPPTTRDLAPVAFAPALERFLELERAGWKGQAGTALANSAADAAYFREAMGAFARDGRAQVWALQAGDTTVASLCAVVCGQGVFNLKTAYDERHASCSPGLLLQLDIVDAFHRDTRLGWIDSCTTVGASPSTLLYPDRRVIQTLVVPLGTRRARIGARALRQALHFKARAGAARLARTSAPPSTGRRR